MQWHARDAGSTQPVSFFFWCCCCGVVIVFGLYFFFGLSINMKYVGEGMNAAKNSGY